MFILALIGAANILAGGLFAWIGYHEGDMVFVAIGISGAISGVLFLALDKGLSLLREIRDALAGEHNSGVEE